VQDNLRFGPIALVRVFCDFGRAAFHVALDPSVDNHFECTRRLRVHKAAGGIRHARREAGWLLNQKDSVPIQLGPRMAIGERFTLGRYRILVAIAPHPVDAVDDLVVRPLAASGGRFRAAPPLPINCGDLLVLVRGRQSHSRGKGKLLPCNGA
jgi:hypothetical protein